MITSNFYTATIKRAEVQCGQILVWQTSLKGYSGDQDFTISQTRTLDSTVPTQRVFSQTYRLRTSSLKLRDLIGTCLISSFSFSDSTKFPRDQSCWLLESAPFKPQNMVDYINVLFIISQFLIIILSSRQKMQIQQQGYTGPNEQNQNPYSVQPQAPLTPGETYNEDIDPSLLQGNQQNQQFATDTNHLKVSQPSKHIQALIGNLILIGGLATGLVLFFTDSSLSVGVFAAIIAGSYVLYLLVGCCFNKLGSYLGNIDRGENFESYYEWIRNGIGHFQFNAQCYHYQIRHHTRRVKDSNGHTRTEHYTSREKVVTHRATENLTPSKTKDQSGVIDRIRAEKSMVFIHFFVKHKFATYQSQLNFINIYQNFKKRHTRDAHQDFTYRYLLPGLVERKAFYVGEMGCNMNRWYYACGLLGLLWPYSLWVERKVSRFSVQSIKVLTI